MDSKTQSNKVMIGDYLGTIEEFLLGEGTYAENGEIFAARIGEKVVDKERHIVKVIGKKPVELQVGQIVFGKIIDVKKNFITVIIKKIQGFNEELDINANLYVANISDSYVNKPEDMFGIGDIIKARVIKIDIDLVDISTKGDFGVVKAFCKKCRSQLVKSEKFKERLVCESCGSKEVRKIASDYGNVVETTTMIHV
ncbi:MAG: exosome complex RNA-binding protein Csl4 [Candidatus Altiarchaeota archaeon]